MKRFWKALVVSGALMFSTGVKANVNVSQLLEYETSMPAQQILSQEYVGELNEFFKEHCSAYRSYYQCLQRESPFDFIPYHRAKFALYTFGNIDYKLRGDVVVDKRASPMVAYWVKDGEIYLMEEGKEIEKVGKASEFGYTEGEFSVFVPDKSKKSMAFVGRALAIKLGFNPRMFSNEFLASLGRAYFEQHDPVFGASLKEVSSNAIASLNPSASRVNPNGRTVGASIRVVIKFPPKEVIQEMIAKAKERARKMAEWRKEVMEKVRNLPKPPKVPVKTKNMKLKLW